MTLGQGEHVEVGTALGQPLAVAGPGVGHDQHPGAGQVGPPAQVEVVAVEVDVRREAAERAEQVDADQQARRRDAEDVAHGVVLLLVQLAGLDRRRGSRRRGRRSSPTCWSTLGRSQSTSFGPTMPAFERYVSATSSLMVDGSSATSSCRKQKKPAPSTSFRAWLAAGPKPGLSPSARMSDPGRRWPMWAITPGCAPVTRNSRRRLG